MKPTLLIAFTLTLVTTQALAALPAGLKCDPTIKIVATEVGKRGKYQVQKGLAKEDHTALLDRKKVTLVDGCVVPDITPGETAFIRYTGPEVDSLEVQCIDQANGNAAVEFPKSIYTVRQPNMSTYELMPYCPDGSFAGGIACSKLQSQSERGGEFKDTILKWKANDPKTKQHVIDLQFDPAYVQRIPPYAPSVPYGAKLFCALVNKSGNVVLAGTAQYPAAAAPPPADAKLYEEKAAGGGEAPKAVSPEGRTRAPRERSK